jgi:hypothetical protein
MEQAWKEKEKSGDLYGARSIAPTRLEHARPEAYKHAILR